MSRGADHTVVGGATGSPSQAALGILADMDILNVPTIRVLIVDDQATFRSAARLVVELSDGFEVVGEAKTGEDAVNLADELRPDLVLMDVNLPGIDGLEATRRIVASGSPARIVVLSTYSRGEYAAAAASAGATAFLSKDDFGPDSLLVSSA